MTAPDGSSPPGSEAIGLFAAHQARTEADAKSAMKRGVTTAGNNAQNQHREKVMTPIADQKVVSVTTIPYNDQAVIRSIYLTNGTWTRPSIPAGKRIQKIGFAAINGGTGGRGSPGGNGDGSEGGDDGGFVYKEFRDADVPSSVAMSIGAGGAAGTPNGNAGSTGGTSTCGSLVTGRSGTSYINTLQGAVSSSCRPGRGGQGGGGNSGGDGGGIYKSPGQKGQNTALAQGGNGGAAGMPGQAGAAADSDPQLVSGGGGGGGGGGWDGTQPAPSGGLTAPGHGGPGGAPGGGGGGAGGGPRNSGIFANGDYQPGGPGANGACIAWIYLEAIPT